MNTACMRGALVMNGDVSGLDRGTETGSPAHTPYKARSVQALQDRGDGTVAMLGL